MFWLASGVGQNCSKEIVLARTETDPAEAQAKYTAFCGTVSTAEAEVGEAAVVGGTEGTGGACAVSIQETLAAMMKAGCGGWEAFIAIAEDIELMCTVDPSVSDSAEPMFCEPLHQVGADSVMTALDASNSVAAREALLPVICTPCFNALFRIKRQNALILRRVYKEPELCITEPNVVQLAAGEEIRYCLPRFESAMENDSLNDKAAAVCDAELMGRCGRLIWAHRLETYGISYEEQILTESYMSHMCGQIILEDKTANAEYCHALTQELSSGFYQVADVNEARDCLPDSTTGECLNPQQCQNWGDQEVDDDFSGSCPSRCQADVDNLVSKFGCCFNSWKLLLQANALADADALANVNDLFARVEYLEGECCSSEAREDGEQNTCSEGSPASCILYPQTTQLSVLVPIPYAWADVQSLEFEAAIKVDIAKALGVLVDAITSLTITPQGDITLVAIDVGSGSAVEGGNIASLLEHVSSTGTFFYDKTSQIYESADCNQSPGTDYCSSAGKIANSLILFALLVCSSLNFAA